MAAQSMAAPSMAAQSMAPAVEIIGRNWMHEVADIYQSEFVTRTHPNIMQWALVGDFSKTFCIMVGYFVFIKYLGPAIMRHRKPMDLRWLMVPYNIFLVIANFYLFFQFMKSRYHGGMEVQCNTINMTLDPEKDPHKYRLAEVTWYYYITKYIELLDTVIFVLRKKDRQLSRLHIIHHTTVPMIVLMLLRSEPAGYNSFFPLMNSFVHSVMYTYYAISAFGDDVTIHLKFKKYITMTQMFQFILVLYYYISRPFYGCHWSGIVAYGNLFLASFFFVLFTNFYWNEYCKKCEADAQERLNENGLRDKSKKL